MHHETSFNVTRSNRNLQGVHTPSESEHKSDTAVMVPTKQKRISPEKSSKTNYYRLQTKLREGACHRYLSFRSEMRRASPCDPKTPDTGPNPQVPHMGPTPLLLTSGGHWTLKLVLLRAYPTVVTPSGGHRNTYGWQAGSTHPTGMLSYLRREIAFAF